MIASDGPRRRQWGQWDGAEVGARVPWEESATRSLRSWHVMRQDFSTLPLFTRAVGAKFVLMKVLVLQHIYGRAVVGATNCQRSLHRSYR